MTSAQKRILVLGACLAIMFCQTQAFGITVSNFAEVTFWYGGDHQGYPDGPKPGDASMDKTDPAFNLSGSAKSTVRDSSSLGAASSSSDARLVQDANFVSSSAGATRSIFLNVTSGGTISYDLSVSGYLQVSGDNYFTLGKAGVIFGSRLSQEGFPYETVPGSTWEGSGEITKQSGNWVYTTTGALGSSSTNQSYVSVDASTDIVTANLSTGLYRFYMSLSAYTSSSNHDTAATASATSDFFNSFGFGDTDVDFWDNVGGTASFYDRDDPTKNHIGAVPVPGALLLLGAGLGRLAIYGRRKVLDNQ